MTHLAISMFGDPEMSNFGKWLFLSVGAVALFVVFIPTMHWLDTRRKEREAYYKSETIRRLAESSGEGAKVAVEFLREEERFRQIRKREGMKIGGLINIAVGIGLGCMFWVLNPKDGPYLIGLIPGLIGVALLVYVFFMAAPVDGSQ
jgi:hypothetical protein